MGESMALMPGGSTEFDGYRTNPVHELIIGVSFVASGPRDYCPGTISKQLAADFPEVACVPAAFPQGFDVAGDTVSHRLLNRDRTQVAQIGPLALAYNVLQPQLSFAESMHSFQRIYDVYVAANAVTAMASGFVRHVLRLEGVGPAVRINDLISAPIAAPACFGTHWKQFTYQLSAYAETLPGDATILLRSATPAESPNVPLLFAELDAKCTEQAALSNRDAFLSWLQRARAFLVEATQQLLAPALATRLRNGPTGW
jgi:uncharacterized protein (TIGR04255 family)